MTNLALFSGLLIFKQLCDGQWKLFNRWDLIVKLDSNFYF